MPTTWKRGKKNQGKKVRERKQRALDRLKAQLKKGFKGEETLLTIKDVTRIEKEIAILETLV